MGWKAIEGYRYPYRINEDARVQKLFRGKWLDIRASVSGRTRATVQLIGTDGQRKNVALVNLMADAFMGGRRKGHCIIHRNGLKLDCKLGNLKFVTKSDCAKLSAKCRRRAVARIDRDGNVVEVYRSLEEAADRTFISRSSIGARCRKEVKDPYDLDGYNYLYEDDTAAINQERKKA